jgi:hypothetical protein
MLVRSLLLVAGLCVSQSVAAVCYFEGKAYPTGARVGVYECQPDGTWRKVGRYLQVPPRPFESAAQLPEKSSPLARRVYRDGFA